MKFQLKGYQTDATADVVEALQEGFARYEKNGKLTAVSLSAPTGAGKTVIATAVIEQLLFGDQGTPPNPDLTILWVTDDPSLNQQTRLRNVDHRRDDYRLVRQHPLRRQRHLYDSGGCFHDRRLRWRRTR